VDGATLIESQSQQDRYIGRMIKGRFRVLSKLGEGAMGTLFLAEQVAIQKKVALKILNSRYGNDEEFIKRFHREARLAAGLNHRNIVTVLDFDTMEDGSFFIAMEYIDGMTLGELIKREGALPISQAVQFGIQLAEGLSAAHQAGVIHRDIKPDNLMVVADGQLLKIMDFGIARSVESEAGTRLTRLDAIMGTPDYMAPEQVNGVDANAQSDLYACGVVLYEMLTGKLPFKAPTPGATLVKQVSEIPVAVRKLRKEIPSAVERVIMQALEKKPENRQKNAAELADALRNTNANLDGAKDAATTIMATRVFDAGDLRRSRLSWKVVTAGSAVALAIVGVWLFVESPTPPESTPTADKSVMHLQPEPVQAKDIAAAPEIPSAPSENQTKVAVTDVNLSDGKPAQPHIVAIESKSVKPTQLAAAAKKKDEPAPTVDSKKRVEDALKRLEEREKNNLKPVVVAPTPPQPAKAPAPATATADPRIRDLVEQKLRNQGLLKVSESDRWGVTVDASTAGVVNLRGLLRDQRLRDDAIRLSREVPGVVDVKANISLPQGAEVH
jgi:serine/threonine protein kinase